MKALMITMGIILVLLLVIVIPAIYGWNKVVTLDEQVKTAWSQVENQYQRRFDLVPNLVNTVKGVANFEKET